MWKWILKTLLAVSSDPAVRAWVQRKARKLIEQAVTKADSIAVAADLPPVPVPLLASKKGSRIKHI